MQLNHFNTPEKVSSVLQLSKTYKNVNLLLTLTVDGGMDGRMDE